MKIVYVANFGAGGNSDEHAIQHALEQLGHTVWPVREEQGALAVDLLPRGPELLLFHKWFDEPTLKAYEGVCPRAFWWFDLVDWPSDPSLYRRSFQRKMWHRAALPSVEFGFLSDGDWVAQDASGKLHFLPQGADERVVGRGKAIPPNAGYPGWSGDILFTGAVKQCGAGRRSFLDEMQARWGDRVLHVERGVYREGLARLIATARVVVCPDAPVTDRYWSNRVWNACGFAGFVLHPWAEKLEGMYLDPSHLRFYSGRPHLHELIQHYLSKHREEERLAVSEAALERTRQYHLYRHRAEKLIATVGGKT